MVEYDSIALSDAGFSHNTFSIVFFSAIFLSHILQLSLNSIFQLSYSKGFPSLAFAKS
jgi:hypothetical protein